MHISKWLEWFILGLVLSRWLLHMFRKKIPKSSTTAFCWNKVSFTKQGWCCQRISPHSFMLFNNRWQKNPSSNKDYFLRKHIEISPLKYPNQSQNGSIISPRILNTILSKTLKYVTSNHLFICLLRIPHAIFLTTVLITRRY